MPYTYINSNEQRASNAQRTAHSNNSSSSSNSRFQTYNMATCRPPPASRQCGRPPPAARPLAGKTATATATASHIAICDMVHMRYGGDEVMRWCGGAHKQTQKNAKSKEQAKQVTNSNSKTKKKDRHRRDGVDFVGLVQRLLLQNLLFEIFSTTTCACRKASKRPQSLRLPSAAPPKPLIAAILSWAVVTSPPCH